MVSLRIEDSAGTERATLPVSTVEIERPDTNTVQQARVGVNRTLLNDVAGIQPGQDRAFIEEGGVDTFGGVLRSPDRQGGRAIVKVRSPAQYMARAPPVPTGQQKVSIDDSTLIQECIDATPELTAGTINTVEAGQTWVFGGISQWGKARKVANAAGGELRFNPDFTVDYLDTIGTDKSGTVLSPANQSFVEDTFEVSRDGVSGNTTHLLVTGVGQGTSQIEVAVVPADDTTTYSQYDRVVTYTNANWSDGDPAIWDEWANKDLKNADAAESYGLKVISDIQTPELTVTTRVKDADVGLSDTFTVRHPEEGVDAVLRAAEVTDVISAEGGTRYEVRFSNQSIGRRDTVVDDHDRTSDYATGAYEGDLTQVQQGPGRGPVGSGHDYIVSVFYPDDVVAEVNAQMRISGLNYRAYSQGAASGGGEFLSSTDNADFTSVVDSSQSSLGLGWSGGPLGTVDLVSATPSTGTSYALGYATIFPTSLSGVSALEGNLYLEVNGTQYPNGGVSFGCAVGETAGVVATVPNDLNGDTIDVTIEETSASTSGSIQYQAAVQAAGKHTHDIDIPEHTHEPNPGILDWDGVEQSPAYYPQNVDVVVNGNSQGFALGDGTGEFVETVDIGGTLTTGWNTIRLTSDQLGHLDASFSADLFRQSL